MDPTTAPSDDGTVDVVIVGAGPIGLATACALAHHGVRFRILERAHGISGESKGHNVIARAQELLHAIGVRDALAEKGYRALSRSSCSTRHRWPVSTRARRPVPSVRCSSRTRA